SPSTWQRLQIFHQWVLENGGIFPASTYLIFYFKSSLLFLCDIINYNTVLSFPQTRGQMDGFWFILRCCTSVGSLLMFINVLLFVQFGYSLVCQPVDYSETPLAMRMARVCWWFYFSKVIVLTDTVFFILRKKNNQLTFLHVYHHGSMIFHWWAGVKYVTGGQYVLPPSAFLIGLINSFVRVVMYMYYGLAALGPQMHKYLWWKQYLTSLQLLQFFIVTIHTAVNLYADLLGYAFSLIALFSNFYCQNYISKIDQDCTIA
uniref:Elongation of very long chain fatty acids protein n=1 Tax=Cyprinus carpio TaxID=7962 RepID=A0A8C2DL78_CYPCA